MQKISFGNKEYVKASEIAKRFRYTQDYVGQLCRNKKVDARLVGRTWYVEPDSVAAYRKTKHSTQKGTATKVALNTSTKRNPNPKSVDAVVRSKTLKTTQQLATGSTAGPSVSYSSDNEVSIPIVSKASKATEAKTLEVKTSESTPPAAKKPEPKKPVQKIKIKKSGSKQTKYTTEKLPEISLSGKLKVKESSDETEQKEQAALSSEVAKSSHRSAPASPKPASQPTAATNRPRVTTEPASAGHTKPAASSFAPKQVQSKRTARSGMLHSDWFLVASLVLGVCSALAILSLASLGQISSSTSNSWSLFFDIAQLKNLVF